MQEWQPGIDRAESTSWHKKAWHLYIFSKKWYELYIFSLATFWHIGLLTRAIWWLGRSQNRQICIILAPNLPELYNLQSFNKHLIYVFWPMSTYIILGSSINLFTSIYRYLFLLLPNMIYILMLPDDCLIWSCPIYPIWSYVISYFPGGWASLDQGTASIADSKEPQRRIDSPSYEKLEARWENMGESTRIKKRTKVHAKRPILSMQISAKLHIPRTFVCGSRLICKLKPFPGSIATWLCKTLPISAHPFYSWPADLDWSQSDWHAKNIKTQ